MRRGNQPCRQGGFTYVAMLFALAVFGIGLAAIGESWSAASRRDKEMELIQIGHAYVKAIGQYYRDSPGSIKTYPIQLADLVEDKRFIGVKRHLRKVYNDPITNGEWGLVKKPDGGITGVVSLSEKSVMRTQSLVLSDAEIMNGARYADWKFVYKEK